MQVIANNQIDVVRYDYNRILEVKPRGSSNNALPKALICF